MMKVTCVFTIREVYANYVVTLLNITSHTSMHSAAK